MGRLLMRDTSGELAREVGHFLVSLHGALTAAVALAGAVLLAFNQSIWDAVTGWGGFSGWYAVGWIALAGLYAVAVAHDRIVRGRDTQIKNGQEQIARLTSEVAELQTRPAPHLTFSGTDVDTDARMQMYQRDRFGGYSVVPIPDEMSWARVLVANDPGELPGDLAREVVATVKFLKPDGSDVLQIEGRWAVSPQAPELSRIGLSKEGRAIDLPANGDPFPLDVAMKYLMEEDCFAYNNENGLRAAQQGGRYEKHRLSGPRFLVRVILKGTNTPRVQGDFLLNNAGLGVPVEWVEGQESGPNAAT